MVKAWKNRINVVKWGLCPDIQLTECEGVWPHTVSVGRQSGGDWPYGVRLCGGSGPHLVSQHVWGIWAPPSLTACVGELGLTHAPSFAVF